MWKIVTYLKTMARYWRMANDPRTPKAVKWLIYTGLIYTFSPIDLLPDYVPGLGLLDDAAVLPGLITLAMMMVPKEVKKEHDREEKTGIKDTKLEGHVKAEVAEKGAAPAQTREIVQETKEKGYLA
jgi:uncharacterized membrane protein YkvA (DUF1232 family)